MKTANKKRKLVSLMIICAAISSCSFVLLMVLFSRSGFIEPDAPDYTPTFLGVTLGQRISNLRLPVIDKTDKEWWKLHKRVDCDFLGTNFNMKAVAVQTERFFDSCSALLLASKYTGEIHAIVLCLNSDFERSETSNVSIEDMCRIIRANFVEKYGCRVEILDRLPDWIFNAVKIPYLRLDDGSCLRTSTAGKSFGLLMARHLLISDQSCRMFSDDFNVTLCAEGWKEGTSSVVELMGSTATLKKLGRSYQLREGTMETLFLMICSNEFPYQVEMEEELDAMEYQHRIIDMEIKHQKDLEKLRDDAAKLL